MNNKIIAFQIDPISSLNFKTDSSLLIANEFQKRGYKILFYSPASLSINQDNRLTANGQFIHLYYDNNKFNIIEESDIDLTNVSLIFIRNDPPFDMNYITGMYMLEKIKNKVLILNDPKGILNAPEKLSIFNYQKFIPPTIVTSNTNKIKNFINNYGKSVIKPLYECAGKDIFVLENYDETLIKKHIKKYQYLLIQKYLSTIKKYGDKRVIIVNGEVAGAIQRMPQQNDFRANIAVGGKPSLTTLTNKEETICKLVGNNLKKANIFLAGIDLIDSYLIEINITSPTGLVSLNNIYDANIEKKIVNKLENKIKQYE